MKHLTHLMKRGRDFLGVEYPIIAGAMSWISHHRFVSSVSNSGGFACLAAGNMPPQELEKEIRKTQDLTDKPFAVNLITISPHYKDHLKVALDNGLPFIIFAGSFPRASEIQTAQKNGAKALAFASNDSIARRMIKSGVDGLILEGSEAGGHIGYVSLTVLLQQVLFNFRDIPIFTAGGIASGRMMAHLLLMGAAGIQMGTRFIMTEECEVNPKFKQAFVKARARDAVATPAIGSELNVVAVRAIKNKGMNEFSELQMDLIRQKRQGEISQKEAQYEVENFWMGSLRNAVQDGDVERGSLMAGQSVGLVGKVQSIKEVFAEMMAEGEETLAEIGRLLL